MKAHVLAIAMMAAAPALAGDHLTIGGTGGSMALAQRLVDAFVARHPGARVAVLPSLGSAGAIRAAADGAIDIAMAGRPMRPKERASGMAQVAYARSPLAFVTSHRTPGNFTRRIAVEMFAGSLRRWPDGAAVRIILRDEDESDSVALFPHVAGLEEAQKVARRRTEVPTATTDHDNADWANRIPGSLTVMTLAQFESEKLDLSVLPLDGVKPSVDNLESGAYPIAKTLFMIIRPGRRADAFAAFVLSAEGAQVLRANGALPMPEAKWE